MEICPIACIFGPIRFKILPKTKRAFIKMSKSFKNLPLWRNFAKSGHTGFKSGLFTARHLGNGLVAFSS